MQLLLLLPSLTKSTLQISLNQETCHLLHPICHQFLSFLTPVFLRNYALHSPVASALVQFLIVSHMNLGNIFQIYLCSSRFGHFKCSLYIISRQSPFRTKLLLLCLKIISDSPMYKVQGFSMTLPYALQSLTISSYLEFSEYASFHTFLPLHIAVSSAYNTVFLISLDRYQSFLKTQLKGPLLGRTSLTQPRLSLFPGVT